MNRYAPALLAVVLVAGGGCDIRSSDLPPTGPPKPAEPPRPPNADDIANRQFASPLAVGDAETILLNTEVFNYHNSPRTIHQAYNVLLAQPDAIERMTMVAARGRRAGQLFALCALWDLSPAAGRTLAAQLSSVHDQVVVYDNDVRSLRSVADMVGVIANEKLWTDLRSRQPGRQ
jgi:hypothetical protein